MGLRCFISINLPDDIKRSIAKIIDELKQSGSDTKWVTPDNIHLTLKFLGSTDETLVPGIRDALQKKFLHLKPFYIKIAGAGCFPSERRPRIIWVGIEDSEILKALQKDVDAEMMKFGYIPEERPFYPHLTIGRVRSPKQVAELMKRLADFRAVDFGDIEVCNIHLMKSVLKPERAEYSSLAEIKLNNRRDDVEQRTE